MADEIEKTIVQSSLEINHNQDFNQLIYNCPIPHEERNSNLALFVKRQQMSRFVFFYEIYQKILNVHGSILEFGVRWGQDLALMSSFRGMLEPFNYSRKIVGFDTFSGFPSLSDKDKTDIFQVGDYGVSDQYEVYLEQLLHEHEQASPLGHIKKFELVKGDVTVTLDVYLERHPETIIAFAYFDLDLYEPTKKCLEACQDRFIKGSIIGFDEINHPEWPGETLALKEVLGLNNVRIQRMPFMPTASYIIVE